MNRASLVIGASGQIGEHCLRALSASGDANAVGTYHQHARNGLLPLDITSPEQIDALLGEVDPAVIYLCACNANVDYCETHAQVAWETNVRGVANVVQAANHHECKLVYLSSEYVFDGAAGPYDELAAPNPISVYGWHKLSAEHYIAAFADAWIVARTTVVYSWESQRKNFLYRLRSSLLQGQSIDVPVDQISSPTYAPDLVRALIDLVDKGARGVFNVAGPRIVTRLELAVAAANAFGLDPALIRPVATPALCQPARRPLNAGLLVGKVENTLGRTMLDFSVALSEMAATGTSE